MVDVSKGNVPIFSRQFLEKNSQVLVTFFYFSCFFNTIEIDEILKNSTVYIWGLGLRFS